LAVRIGEAFLNHVRYVDVNDDARIDEFARPKRVMRFEMTKILTLLRDARGASAVMVAIIGGLICVIWVEFSKLTGVSATDLVEVAAYKLGLTGN
jgi:Flp pilus assembly pilin Flp